MYIFTWLWKILLSAIVDCLLFLIYLFIFSAYFSWVSNTFLIDLQRVYLGNWFSVFESRFRYFPSFLFAFAYSGFRIEDFFTSLHVIQFIFYFIALVIISMSESFPQSETYEKQFIIYNFLFILWFNFYSFIFIFLCTQSQMFSNVRSDMQI